MHDLFPGFGLGCSTGSTGIAYFSAQLLRTEERRNIERMMSECFTWFPIGDLG
jgi:hypothetical protein